MADIPDIIHAGDSREWTEDVGEYPADPAGRCTTYYAARRRWTSIPRQRNRPRLHRGGGEHRETSAGRFSWQSYVTNIAGKRFTVSTGSIFVRANLAAQNAGFDGRSHAQKTLDAIEATMEGRATKSQVDHADQQPRDPVPETRGTHPVEDRSSHVAEVNREKVAEKVMQGEDPGNRILTRFRDDSSRGAWPLNRAWRWPW